MVRQSTKIDIPEIYTENEKKGICRVCGGKIKNPFRKYCSTKCSLEYQKCFYDWSSLRNKIIYRDIKCIKCGSKLKLEVDHIKAIVNGGNMWDESNLQVLCHKCHIVKTKTDLYKRKYVKKRQKSVSDFTSTSKKEV